MRESMRVLIPVDGSESSLSVIEQAARIPWPKGSRLLVLGVAEMPSTLMAGPIPMPGTYYQEWEMALEEQARSNVVEANKRFVDGGGVAEMVESMTIRGNTKEAIIDEAAKFGADLIMIGTHGYNAIERMWLGSVSRTVASHARCSVEIVRPFGSRGKDVPEKKGMRLLVAVDGSSFGDAAVAEVAERPWPDGSEVRVVTAIHLPFVPTPETWVLPEELYAEAEKHSREQADLTLQRAEKTIAESNASRRVPLGFSRETMLGHAEEVIISTAREWEADLILLGSHGHRAWERFILGSVSQAVAWHAPCSVEIVRTTPGEK
jgi:nucleotide-binding universal stress UspA family protein